MHTWFCVTQHLLTYPVGMLDRPRTLNSSSARQEPDRLPVRSRIDRERRALGYSPRMTWSRPELTGCHGSVEISNLVVAQEN
jgi:hypothetical protein